MPSFDIVSEVDVHEVRNAVDQANREIGTRFDFKGSDSHIDISELKATLVSQSEFQLEQMLDILRNKLVKRSVDTGCMKIEEPQASGKAAKQEVTFRHGLTSDMAREIVKRIKEKKLKVQAAIQGEQVRVTGKKRDDLQSVIAMLREQKLELPLQYTNFRD
ncbi:MAG: YajQ family cyclic di-GMP-binding protein [Gammaproteobacteria bacterium]|nr:YajQ family cyclic di-GMP-binding protein [Gammaproteobacteria bacterium]